jgi:predicted nucleotidyltransferase
MSNQFGLSEEDLKAIHNVFEAYPQVETAILYGSRAMGTHRKSSDIDITLVGSGLSLTILFRIGTDLDDLLLPYKIDLSIYHKIQNPDLLTHISTFGKVLYKTN